MIGGWGGVAIGVIFAAAAGQSAVAATTSLGDRPRSFFATCEADVTHVVMNGLMAVMATPLYTQGRQGPLIVVLAATALGLIAVFLLQTARKFGVGRLSLATRAFGTGYHVAMLVAMIYATRLMAPSRPMGGMPMVPRALLSLPNGLAAIFAMDALVGAAAVTFAPAALMRFEAEGANNARSEDFSADPVSPRVIRSLRLGLLPHLVMDLGMAAMLAQL